MSQEKNKIIEAHYRENFDRLVGFVNRFFKNKSHSEDVVQEAYKRSIEYYNNAENFGGWFNTILSNCIRDKWRIELTQGMGQEHEIEEQVVKPAAIPTIIYKEVVERINKQEPKTAQILTLFLIEQYKPKEIEQIMNERASVIRDVVFKFRQQIKQEMRWAI